MKARYAFLAALCVLGSTSMIDCSGEDGLSGGNGVSGENGANGQNGQDGKDGVGRDGRDGANGIVVGPGDNVRRAPGVDPSAPLSSVVAFSWAPNSEGAQDIPQLARALVARYVRGDNVLFPVSAAATDSLRTVRGLSANVALKWLDPLTFDGSANAPRFGANNDFIAYFGDGWSETPAWNGSGESGWLWVNHEYVSGASPTVDTEPTSQNAIFGRFLAYLGITPSVTTRFSVADVDRYVAESKRQVGGSWMRVIKDAASQAWAVDRNANNLRYDATSNTQLRITGTTIASGRDHADDGTELPEQVVAGIMGDCSGATTPWGTVITAEENVQDYYGDLESCWDSQQRLLVGRGCDVGAPIRFELAPSTASEFGRHSSANERHARDLYGYLAEIDPGVAPSEYEGKVEPGRGHKKLGAMGRARWENATFATDIEGKLKDGQPVVLYAGDDRRSGRIYKFVSARPYAAGMSRAETRALLDEGRVYAAHLEGLDNLHGLNMAATGVPPTIEARGQGRWIWLSINNEDQIAPNAPALAPGTTVGAALRSTTWNRLGSFASDDDVKRALFTASNKLGIMELNRPEDIEWNARSPLGVPQLFVAFTKHGRRTALDASGVVFDPPVQATASQIRNDELGAIFGLEESDPLNPSASTTFSFFQAWGGREGSGLFDAANPDNIAIDREGGVWFGTDGNFGINGHSDAIYFLNLDATHREGQPDVMRPGFGEAFRILAVPSDAEATGPAFSADQRSLFISVQHPGEEVFSVWP